MLLLHGALGSAAQLLPLARLLEPAGPVRTLDFAGHGPAAPGEGPPRIEALATQVREHLASLEVGRTAIFGYSMGGYVALHLAATAPELVSGVVTLATKLAWTPETAQREVRQLDPDSIRAKVPRFAEALAARHTAAGWERVLADTASLLRALGDDPPLTDQALARVSCPVRLIVGDRDATVSVEETLAAARLIPGAELEVLPGTPHALERAPLPRLAASILERLAQ